MLRDFIKFSLPLAAVLALEWSSAPFALPRQQPSKPAPKYQVLPLDPLSPGDRTLAEKIAREDPRVRELLGTRPLLVSIALLFLKPEHEESPTATKPLAIDRHAEVLFRREDETGVRAIVNLSKKSVLSSDRVSSMELPLIAEDIGQAAKLALANDELRGLLAEDLKNYAAAAEAPGTRTQRYAISGLRLFSKGDDDPCTKHRCVQLMFRRGRDYLADVIVWVDLTEHHVYVERSTHESH